MAVVIEKLKAFFSTPVGRIVETLVYVGLTVLILIYFDGKGEFIYEGF